MSSSEFTWVRISRLTKPFYACKNTEWAIGLVLIILNQGPVLMFRRSKAFASFFPVRDARLTGEIFMISIYHIISVEENRLPSLKGYCASCDEQFYDEQLMFNQCSTRIHGIEAYV